jgi:hypothetical protein
MGIAADAIDMANDPVEFFKNSDAAAHAVPREEADALQLEALRHRFATMREQLPVLRSTADEMGIEAVESLDDGARLLFPHTVYKSYPISLLEKGRFDQLTKWLNRLTTCDLGGVRTADCRGIDDWLDALERDSDLALVHSSGTGGLISFTPRSKADGKLKGRIFAMTSRDFFGLDESFGTAGNEPYEAVFTGYRHGYAEAGRSVQWLFDHFAGSEDRMHTLHPGRPSSDVVFLAARARRAEARGEIANLEIPEHLMARQAEFEETQRNAANAIDRMFETLMSLQGRKVYLGGMTSVLVDFAQRGLARGLSGIYGPDCVVQTGGGSKGVSLPDNWEDIVLEFTGARRIAQYYAMSELMFMSGKCSEGHYHIQPWVITYVLDPDTGLPRPRAGVQTGRAAFFDPAPQGYWGGFATGDQITVDWTPCPCGRTTAHLHPQIQRLRELQGGDDKITCAAAEQAHAAAIDFMTQVA